MKKSYTNIFTIALIIFCARANSQTVSTFENISLATDSFKNGNDWSGGYASGNALFVNHYDTSFGFTSWDGFAISNKRDTVNAAYTNQYAAITGKGVNNSTNYAVGYYDPYSPMRIKLTGAAKGKQVSGFYITNSTYAYGAMKDGSSFNKKFGGATGNDPDWFKLTIKGFKNGTRITDSVEFYLSDFRFTDHSQDYFVKVWTWVDMTKLGNVDSIEFTMSSSDTAGGFGMNNPAYFCLDNFTTTDHFTGIDEANINQSSIAIYPNPAKEFIVIDGGRSQIEITIFDLAGREMIKQQVLSGEKIPVSTLSKGIYFLEMKDENRIQTKKLIIE